MRSTDIVGRLGGDEFVILQPLLHGRDDAAELAERIFHKVESPFDHENVRYRLGCSIGISLFPTDGTDGAALLERADAEMYRAKVDRRNVAVFTA